MMQTFIADMMQRYEMFDLGLLHHFLGMKIIQTKSSIFIHQRKYAASLLNKFRLQNCKVVSIPLVRSDKLRNDDDSGATDETQYRKIVGSLLYLTATKGQWCMLQVYWRGLCIVLQTSILEQLKGY